MKVAIIGGSIGGLITGIALRKIGYQVDIYERSALAMEDRGAGLVIQPGLMNYMVTTGISSNELFGVPATERQILNDRGHAAYKYENDTSFTSWNYLWKQLKDYFPESHYHYGHRVTGIHQEAAQVTATFFDGKTSTTDLLIGADGYSSVVREHILPGIEPIYSGYVAFRGLIAEKDLTDAEVEFFSNKFTLYPYSNSHLLAYLVPGNHGELNKGERQLNWVWYLNKNAVEHQRVMTDKDGRLRQFSVPATFLSAGNIKALKDRAQQELPEILAQRVLQTANPFVQSIVDMKVPKMYQGSVVILGDAASVVRPHTASGTAKAYEDAVGLAAALSGNETLGNALKSWDVIQRAYADELIAYGKKLARGSGLG